MKEWIRIKTGSLKEGNEVAKQARKKERKKGII